MPDISTANQQKINGLMCPICHEFSVGSRIAYLTTAGAYSSGTLNSCDITSGTHDSVNFVNSVMTKQYARYAPAACTGTTDALALAHIDSGGVYILDPNNASGFCVCITSAATTGMWLRLINISTGATGLVHFGATGSTISGEAFLASATSYYDFCIRANSAVDLMAVSATRWIFVGGTASVSNLGVTTA